MPIATKITFQMDGPEFSEGVPILKVVDALKDFHSTVDKGYLALIGKSKLTQRDRTIYTLSATRIGIGSFYSDISIIVPATYLAMGLVPPGTSPGQVWEVVKNAFEFLKTLASLRRDGKEPAIEITSAQESGALMVVGDHNNITVNQTVFTAADRGERHIKSLARLVDGEHVETLSALDASQEGIKLLPEDNGLFNPATAVEDKSVKLVVKIYRLDVESKSGRLRILDGAREGDFRFFIRGRQSMHAYISALESERSMITALREVVVHPTGAVSVAAYHVLEIAQ
jgi:hypothetical protein